MGLDLTSLLDRADRMREGCASCVPVRDNHGAWLGSVMGANALNGRDKLTLVTSPSVSSFGLWAEQLLAESTGKEGRGIVPIAGEPLLPAAAYGDDRLFVYLRLEGDDNSHTDPWMGAIRSSGHPVVRLDLRDKYDLGGEFFRWEYATAVAGSILGIHPFDQPDVQGAKDMTGRVLQEHQATDRLPQAQPGTALEPAGSLKALLSRAAPGDYLAVVAYVLQTPVVDEALGELRRVVMERYRVATTLGYGPRYLHSTGQLHKGGAPHGAVPRPHLGPWNRPPDTRRVPRLRRACRRPGPGRFAGVAFLGPASGAGTPGIQRPGGHQPAVQGTGEVGGTYLPGAPQEGFR